MTNIKKPLIILLLFVEIIAKTAIAQTDSLKAQDNSFSKNTIYFEVLGTGGLYSFNYDRIVLSKNKFKGSFTVGLSYGGIGPSIVTKNSDRYGWGEHPVFWNIVIPCKFNFFFGKIAYIEAGFGPTLVINTNRHNLYGSGIMINILTLNYRYQRNKGGYFFKCGASISNKLIEYKNEWLINSIEYPVTINLSFGYTFAQKKKNK